MLRPTQWPRLQHQFNKLLTYLSAYCTSAAFVDLKLLFVSLTAPHLGQTEVLAFLGHLGLVVALLVTANLLAVGQFSRICNTMRAIVHLAHSSASAGSSADARAQPADEAPARHAA